MKKSDLITKAAVTLSHGRGTVERNIYRYEDKAIFKHNGTWQFCKEDGGQWFEYEIRISQYQRLVPKP